MKWTDVANYAIPFLGIVLPKARELAPLILQSVNEAQRAFPDSDETREQKRQHVFASVLAATAATASATDRQIDAGQAIAATQAVFQAIDAIHAIAKAQQTSAVPSTAAKP
jgi:hypothetical protein